MSRNDGIPQHFGEIVVRRIDEPRAKVADQMLGVGYEAWRDALPNRTDREIREVYDPDSLEAIKLYMSKMEDIGRFGVFMAAYTVGDIRDYMVGYIGATPDTPRTGVKQLMTTLKRQRPFAHIEIVNVLPGYQRVGIGSALVSRVLQQPEFEPDWHPTARVFHENFQAQRFLVSRALMKKTPSSQVPEILSGYFGKNSKPPELMRYEGPELEVVVDALSSRELEDGWIDPR